MIGARKIGYHNGGGEIDSLSHTEKSKWFLGLNLKCRIILFLEVTIFEKSV